MRIAPFRTSVLSVAAVAALALAGCSSDDGTAADSAATGSDTAATSAAADGADGETAESEVTLTDGWVRADQSEMTGLFGTLHNPTDADLVLTSADVDVDARAEMHETVQDAGSSMMKEAENGLAIPAGGTLELKPGSYHIMLMELAEPIQIGQEVHLTLHFEDGTTAEVTVAGRAFEGANEEYQSSDHGSMGSGEAGHEGHEHGDHGDHAGHEHGDHEHGSEPAQ